MNPDEIRRLCKSKLVNIVLENYKSQREGKPLIPIVFCIDVTNNEYPLFTRAILSRTDPANQRGDKLFTHSELRRAYKLCYDEKVDPAICDIAKRSFHFVKVERAPQTKELKLQRIQAPWEAADWEKHWAMRQDTAKTLSSEKPHNWRQQANAFAAMHCTSGV